MKRWIRCLSLLLLALLCGCGRQQSPTALPPATEMTAAEKAVLIGKAQTFMEYVTVGSYDLAYSMFSKAMADVMPEKKIGPTWDRVISAYGPYASVDWDNAVILPVESNQLLRAVIRFDRKMELRLSFNPDAEIDGFFVLEMTEDTLPAPTPKPPAGIDEEEIAFDSQPNMPLRGVYTFPKEGPRDIAVVLVHGSGPQDRDETIKANAPFRDLARGLAERGIASVRYDKCTFLYPLDAQTITVDQETALDAVAAAKWLREEKGARYVFIVGHSQGGMLASYIQSLGAGADGLISLAGSPRNFVDLLIDQNHLAAQAYRDQGDEKEAIEVDAYTAAESAKLQLLAPHQASSADIPEETTIFGLPIPYVFHWAGIDAAALHLQYDIPALFLQGGRDIQVYADQDFAMWQEALAGHPDATFKLYEDLNHLFGLYTGEPTTILTVVQEEYGMRTPVDVRILDDIAQWIFDHTE